MIANVLLALDGTDHSTKSARYVGSIFGKGDDVSITLFYVLATIPAMTLEYCERMAKTVGEIEQDWTKAEKESASRHLEKIKCILKEIGFQDGQINTKCSNPTQGSNVAHAICEECKNGHYDTIVIGKHGHSKIYEFLKRSIAEKVVRHTNGCVVLVVE